MAGVESMLSGGLSMRSYRTALVSAFATVMLPVFGAYAEDSASRPRSAAVNPPPQTAAPPARIDTPAAPAAEVRSAGLKLNLDATSASPRSDEFRSGPSAPGLSPRPEDLRLGPAPEGGAVYSRAGDYGLPGSTAGGTGLKLTPAPYAARPGWEMSGRVGPLRFVSPLDNEGETQMRLGGRLPGQPRIPGGLFNLGIHYNFE